MELETLELIREGWSALVFAFSVITFAWFLGCIVNHFAKRYR
jgi:hypothetical protein